MKAKLGIFLLVLCVASYFLYNRQDPKNTQAKIEKLFNGKIVSATDEQPIEGVTVAIAGTNPKTKSNAEGEYLIMAKKDQELVFKHPRYRAVVAVAEDAKLVKMEVLDADFVDQVNQKAE